MVSESFGTYRGGSFGEVHGDELQRFLRGFASTKLLDERPGLWLILTERVL